MGPSRPDEAGSLAGSQGGGQGGGCGGGEVVKKELQGVGQGTACE